MSHQYLNTSANMRAKTNLGRLATRARKTRRHLFLLVKSHAASDRICPKLKASCLIRQLLLQWPFSKNKRKRPKQLTNAQLCANFWGSFSFFVTGVVESLVRSLSADTSLSPNFFRANYIVRKGPHVSFDNEVRPHSGQKYKIQKFSDNSSAWFTMVASVCE